MITHLIVHERYSIRQRRYLGAHLFVVAAHQRQRVAAIPYAEELEKEESEAVV